MTDKSVHDREESTHWHALELDDLQAKVESSDEGLSQDEAEKRLHETGLNTLEAEEDISPLRILVRQVHNPLIYLLLGAAVVSLFADHPVDAAVIVGVVVLNTLLGFIQEWRAEGALAALRHMAAPHARVARDGESVEISAEEVVPGDVLLLETGDRVAADARLIASDELRIDESALTGEAQPVAKQPGSVDPDAALGDRSNMVWMATSVTGGRGRAMAVATGMQTAMGAIASEVRSTTREMTPLQKRMHTLGFWLGGTGILLAGIVFVLGLLRGYELFEMMIFAVAVAVSAIPEGLPAAITVTLALGVRRMAARHALIRRLPAVETLGSVTVICSDKTGTITENQMTVRRIWAAEKVFEVTGEGYRPEGEIRNSDSEPLKELPETLNMLLRSGALVNNANLREKEGSWKVEGNPSEGALLAAAQKAGTDLKELRHSFERLHEVPFSSDRKYMATLHSSEKGHGRVAMVKGAPDRVLSFSTHILLDGERVELDDAMRDRISRANDDFAQQALRVMGGAYREFDNGQQSIEPDEVEGNLTFLGLWGMIDPPRKESAPAVSEARAAGIRPVLITGDYAATALAIARQVGIAEDGEALGPSDIEEMDNEQLATAAMEQGVFARVSPAHKLKIMEALKSQGQIVAMTGDGVNDAPALKGSDIGVAMGKMGTEVAREAADMVLTDDNFATIVHAVEEGRVIYNNLRGVIFFLLCANAGEILALSGALMLGMELPMTATMILWVNLVTAGACTIPLGIEPAHEDVLTEPPRNPNEPIVDVTMIRRLALLTPLMGIGTLFLFWWKRDGDLAQAQTIAFTAMVVFQWFQALNARSQRMSVFSIGFFSNRWLLVGVAVAVLLQLLVIYSPLGVLLGTAPLAAMDWVMILLVASSVWVGDEILKALGVHGRYGAEGSQEQPA